MINKIKEQIELLISQSALYQKFKRPADLNNANKTKQNLHKAIENLISQMHKEPVIKTITNGVTNELFNNYKKSAKDSFDTLYNKFTSLQTEYNKLTEDYNKLKTENNKKLENEVLIKELQENYDNLLKKQSETLQPKKKGRPKKNVKTE